ncbi:MAG: hypothetical protein JXA30_18070 [Deltaproteobacteria bacterium]|nr:hypothetical protein [Deltaproteobacteria bacterium]
MLHPFIIEQIKKREQEEKNRRRQPVLQLPLPEYYIPSDADKIPPDSEEDSNRVVIFEW